MRLIIRTVAIHNTDILEINFMYDVTHTLFFYQD